MSEQDGARGVLGTTYLTHLREPRQLERLLSFGLEVFHRVP